MLRCKPLFLETLLPTTFVVFSLDSSRRMVINLLQSPQELNLDDHDRTKSPRQWSTRLTRGVQNTCAATQLVWNGGRPLRHCRRMIFRQHHTMWQYSADIVCRNVASMRRMYFLRFVPRMQIRNSRNLQRMRSNQKFVTTRRSQSVTVNHIPLWYLLSVYRTKSLQSMHART